MPLTANTNAPTATLLCAHLCSFTPLHATVQWVGVMDGDCFNRSNYCEPVQVTSVCHYYLSLSLLANDAAHGTHLMFRIFFHLALRYYFALARWYSSPLAA